MRKTRPSVPGGKRRGNRRLPPPRSGRKLPHPHELADAPSPPDRTPGVTPSPLGLHIGRYEVLRELGAGATGVVYLARDPVLGRAVAIKLLAHSLSQDETAVHRFTEEARLASSLDHPRIITIHEIGRTEDDRLFIAMAYHEGETLRNRLTRGPLPVADAVRIAAEIADGLTAAHAQGVVHRDVKPDNILLTPRGACILDFGIAKIMGASFTQTRSFLGTAAYMSPEQTSGDPVDQRADVWSLGVVLYEMLTGLRPFRAESADAVVYAIRHDAPTPVSELRPEIGVALATVVADCLEKDPERRPRSAALVGSALTAPGILTGPTGLARAGRLVRRILPRGVGAALLIGALALGVGVAGWLRNAGTAPTLDANLLVVVPFDVIGADLDVWREGMVDVLSSGLDGAGPLRTAAPSAVIRGWEGRADRPSVQAFASGLGAGFAVYGRIVGAGGDSVRLSASVLDVTRESRVREIEVLGLRSRMDQVADSLAIGILTALSGIPGVGAEQLNSLGSRSTAALRAFLRGEQHFRAMRLDSAAYYYERAIDEDSTFVLALNRMGLTLGWQGVEGPNKEFLRRAGELNHGLAPRESLLVVSDSLSTSFGVSEGDFLGDSATWARLHRFFSTLDLATRLYPDDVGAWSRLGEAQAHWGTSLGATDRQTLRSFERVMELDSSFAPAYAHLLDLTLAVHGVEAGRRVIGRLLGRFPTGDQTEKFRLTGQLLDPDFASLPDLDARLATESAAALSAAAWGPLRYLTDSTEVIIHVANALAQHPDTRGNNDRYYQTAALGLRGHVRAGYDTLVRQRARPNYTLSWDYPLMSEVALLGGVPREAAAAEFGGWLRDFEEHFVPNSAPRVYLAIAWWNREGDRASLDRVAAAAEANIRPASSPVDSARLRYVRDLARGYSLLVRGDSAKALAQFRTLPLWPGPLSFRERLTMAQLMSWSGNDLEASRVLETDARLPFPRFPIMVPWLMERARVQDRLGHRDEALAGYLYVAGVWRYADPHLQPLVQEARAAIARLRSDANASGATD